MEALLRNILLGKNHTPAIFICLEFLKMKLLTYKARQQK